MPDPYRVQPDREFLHRVLRGGGEDLKQCFQCATCSTVCELSTGRTLFPRKEMIWAQWGLQDRLAADPDLWRCYQCQDCSTRCPRGARPGDVMGALRREVVMRFAVPGFLTKWANEPKYLPLLLGIPAVLLALLVAAPLEAGTSQKIVYSCWSELPHWALILFFGGFSILALVALVVGVTRFWRAMVAADAAAGVTPPAKAWGTSISAVLRGVFVHDHFGSCTTERSREISHLMVFYGFLALLVVAIWVVGRSLTASFNPLILEGMVYPFNFWNPWRMLGNLGGIAVVAGCGWMLYQRLGKGRQIGPSDYSDWFLLWTLLLVAATGLLAEALHYARMEPHRLVAYFIHLVLVFALLIYLPYSKLAHLAYRAAALVYAEYSGRTAAAPAAVGQQLAPAESKTAEAAEVPATSSQQE